MTKGLWLMDVCVLGKGCQAGCVRCSLFDCPWLAQASKAVVTYTFAVAERTKHEQTFGC